MGLLQKLQTLGYQLKLVRMVPKTSTTPEKIETRSVTLQELTTELQTENVRILADSPVELTIKFEKIFETAGIIGSSKKWTIERFCNLLSTAPYRDMDTDGLKKAVLETFAAENVSPEEIIKDALAKDQALDAFEKFIAKKMKQRASARQMRLMEVEKEIGSLQKEKERLQQDDSDEPLRLSEWQTRKQAYEKDILEKVDFLMRFDGQSSGIKKIEQGRAG